MQLFPHIMTHVSSGLQGHVHAVGSTIYFLINLLFQMLTNNNFLLNFSTWASPHHLMLGMARIKFNFFPFPPHFRFSLAPIFLFSVNSSQIRTLSSLSPMFRWLWSPGQFSSYPHAHFHYLIQQSSSLLWAITIAPLVLPLPWDFMLSPFQFIHSTIHRVILYNNN